MWAFGGISQHLAQPVDGFLERQLIVDEGVVRPEALAEFFPRHDFLRTLQQGLQNLKRLARELLPHSPFAHLSCRKVHFKDAEPYYLRRAGAGGNGELR